MTSFLGAVNKLAKNFADTLDHAPGAPDNNGSGGVKVSLATSSREELGEFIKKQGSHIKKVEARCNELFEAYKKVSKERTDLAQEHEDLREKYKLLCGSIESSSTSAKVDTSDGARDHSGAQNTDSAADLTASATTTYSSHPLEAVEDADGDLNRRRGRPEDLEKLIARLEVDRDSLKKQLDEALAVAQEAEQQREALKEHIQKAKEDREKERERMQNDLTEAKRSIQEALEAKVVEAHARMEEQERLHARREEEIQETMQRNFQMERQIMKGEIMKFSEETQALKESAKNEKAKFEEDLLNMELERRTLEEKLEELKTSAKQEQEEGETKKKEQDEIKKKRARGHTEKRTRTDQEKMGGRTTDRERTE